RGLPRRGRQRARRPRDRRGDRDRPAQPRLRRHLGRGARPGARRGGRGDPARRCRAREGQPGDGARGRRRGGDGVKQVRAAAVWAMRLGILSGPAFIAFLRRNEFGQQIREEGPAGHMSKQGTPTLGGLVLLACTLLSFLVFTRRTTPGLAVAGTMLACGAIGFVDDYLKLTNRRSLGLSGRWKMLGLAGGVWGGGSVLGWGAVVAGVAVVAHHEHLSTDIYVPVLDTHVPLGPAYYVF